nr:ribonuclease H-like domain-containing protein [Tanacetum cinerariifolium]
SITSSHGNQLGGDEELEERHRVRRGYPKGGKITGKGKIKTCKLDIDDVYFLKELKFNLFSVSQICDKKNSDIFTDTECLVLSLDFKLPDESQVLLRVPRENNMYNVNLKNIVHSRDLTCLFAKAILDESNLWHRRTLIEAARIMLVDLLLPIPFWAEAVNTACYVQNQLLVTKPHNKTLYELLHGRIPSIGFMRPFGCSMTILNTLNPLGKFKRKVDEGFLVGYSNNEEDAAFDGKEHGFDAKKPESEVNVSPSNSAQLRKQDDKTKKEAKGKRYRYLSAEFEDCSDNSSNEVNAAGSIVPTVGQNSLNSTNTFSTAGPSNTAVSPTYGKSSFIDASQLPDDPDMPELEDITYFDGEDVVGAKADFNNLESSIPISHIPTTRIHKDHHGLDPDHPNKIYKVVKALYGLHQAPRAWYETLATCLLENCFQKGTIDQTLFIKKQKGDILLVKQKKDGIFISQDKYVAEILRKFRLTEGKSASTPIDIEKPLLKDPDGEDDNDVTRLQALVDKKKVVVTEAAIREVLRLDDAEGVDCLPNEEIFAKLARIGYEKPSIKLTFYKAFFLSQWKFLIHTILQSMSAKRTSWNEFSSAMTSVVICLSTGVKTPLFEGMIVEQVIEEGGAEGEHVEEDTAALNACTALSRRVEHLEYDKVAQALEITKLKRRVKRLEKEKKERIIDEMDKDDVVALMDDKEDDNIEN